MGIRNVYWGLIILLSGALLFEWTSEKRSDAIQEHLSYAESFNSSFLGDEYVSIESEELFLIIAVKTGSIIETRLKKYPVENVPGSLGFRVFGSGQNNAFNYYFKSGFTKSNPVFSVDVIKDNSVRLIDDELGISKLISFSEAPYEVLVLDSSSNGVEGKSFAGLYRTAGRPLDLKSDALSGGMMNNGSYLGVAISTDSEPYETTKLNQIDEGGIESLSRSGWVAFVQKYFFAALIGSEDFIYNFYALPSEGGLFRMGYTVENPSAVSSVFEHEHRIFVGPKIRKDLMGRADNLELTIEMGWFWFLAQPMVFAMDAINAYVGNWGLTIVIFTLLIKMVFWPITAKSFTSMAAMRKITPELNEIKQRYKNDNQKIQAETMKLFKEHGANPLGGCLPILIQMPFFIGFFFALREMVELRHSTFGVWSDLSVPDPYFLFPVAFAVLMTVTQRLNPQPAGMDPTQAQVMKYMPVMFSLFFVVMPAALGLYMVVNTGVQLAQQAYMYKKSGALTSG
tara:strand:+ start:345 stop:1877 length:1533 start_codon:yes stop_codon:yes gene_type:complete